MINIEGSNVQEISFKESLDDDGKSRSKNREAERGGGSNWFRGESSRYRAREDKDMRPQSLRSTMKLSPYKGDITEPAVVAAGNPLEQVDLDSSFFGPHVIQIKTSEALYDTSIDKMSNSCFSVCNSDAIEIMPDRKSVV